jgi:bacterioferritin
MVPESRKAAGTMKKKVIDLLNEALAIEYSAVIQYIQFAALVQGADRQLYKEIFEGSSKESREHAQIVSDLIVSIGGTPTIETAHIRQTTEAKEMLEQGLATEREALDTYQKAHDALEGESGLKYMLEERIIAEQEDVWEFEKLLKLHQVRVAKKEINLSDAG